MEPILKLKDFRDNFKNKTMTLTREDCDFLRLLISKDRSALRNILARQLPGNKFVQEVTYLSEPEVIFEVVFSTLEGVRRENLYGPVQAEIQTEVHEMFACPVCQSRNVAMRDVQTRSADEGSVLILKCRLCANQWTR